jgi:predicted ABC-type ATPase
MDFSWLDQRPLVVAVAGPNGAGKTTFFHSHLRSAALPFVNADVLADELNLDAYDAARLADAMRRELVARRESFIFETHYCPANGFSFRRKFFATSR